MSGFTKRQRERRSSSVRRLRRRRWESSTCHSWQWIQPAPQLAGSSVIEIHESKLWREHSRFMNMKIHSLRLVALALFSVSFLAAQPVDDTQLKQVIVFGRHGVRSPAVANSPLNTFSVRPFPRLALLLAW